jgi:hypothetical protein
VTTERADQDAAAVIAVLAVLAAGTEPEPPTAAPRAEWGRPVRILGAAQPGEHRWWASGLPG